eukprot:CAMPEP_0175180764 /NCGR_PEP_ID=MMETSP0087-20121206/36271_1 /TAXON_ID=136419 /ORGANISM="Unknown Unknown, Strain D1" /LENGTH=98 /DNA_ID=CAMNT_0016473185 /DNA_START=369 /DNA_END=662 /DNA_ORIENTATION=+
MGGLLYLVMAQLLCRPPPPLQQLREVDSWGSFVWAGVTDVFHAAGRMLAVSRVSALTAAGVWAVAVGSVDSAKAGVKVSLGSVLATAHILTAAAVHVA